MNLEPAMARLLPLIDDHDLVVTGTTAATLYLLTSRPARDAIELQTRHPLTDSAERALLDATRRHLDSGASSSHTDPRMPTGHIVAAVRTGHQQACAVDIRTAPTALTPADIRRTPVAPGSFRVPTIDQPTVGHQTVRRWLTHPTDLTTTLDLGLVVDRLGPTTVWTGHNLPARRDELVARLLEVRRSLDHATVNGHDAERARHGIDALAQHLAVLGHQPPGRSRR